MSFFKKISKIVKKAAPLAVSMYAPSLAPLLSFAQGKAPALQDVMPAVLTTPQAQGTQQLLLAAVGIARPPVTVSPADYDGDYDDDYDDGDYDDEEY